ATLALDREFANGIKVGAFATLTDVPFDTFGEGSFDKGIRISLPMAFFTGAQTQKVSKVTLRPLLRDGGARLDVEGRLYDTVRPYQETDLDAAWGRFWR
ncbi:MAG: YjbH domain-containing protein, partial [Cypionkella sp.]|nr:YjbH domain-containing protein [Cypionkella sp.]